MLSELVFWRIWWWGWKVLQRVVSILAGAFGKSRFSSAYLVGRVLAFVAYTLTSCLFANCQTRWHLVQICVYLSNPVLFTCVGRCFFKRLVSGFDLAGQWLYLWRNLSGVNPSSINQLCPSKSTVLIVSATVVYLDWFGSFQFIFSKWFIKLSLACKWVFIFNGFTLCGIRRLVHLELLSRPIHSILHPSYPIPCWLSSTTPTHQCRLLFCWVIFVSERWSDSSFRLSTTRSF